jgi:hypothetical protein
MATARQRHNEQSSVATGTNGIVGVVGYSGMSVCPFLLTANVVTSTPILVTLIMEALPSSET